MDTDPGDGHAADGAELAAVWMENGDNDLLTGEGVNTIRLRRYTEGEWQDAMTVWSGEGTVSDLALEWDDGPQVRYSITSEGATVSYRYYNDYYSGCWDTEETETLGDHQWAEGRLFELRETELYCNDEPTGLEGLTNFRVVSSGDLTAVLTMVPTGFTSELFGSYYDAGSGNWGPWVQLTGFGKYIRSYSAVLEDSGKLVAALNLVNVLPEAERIYDDTTAMLAVVDDCAYTDLAVEEWLSFDASLVVPGGALPLRILVTNNSMETLDSVTVTSGEQSWSVPCSLGAGESGELTVEYALPQSLEGLALELEVTPDYVRQENDTSNNRASAVVGLADLKVEATAPVPEGDGAAVTVTVSNAGCTAAEAAVLTVRRGNLEGEILAEASLGDLDAGQSVVYVFSLPEDMLYTENTDTMLALCFEVKTETEELLLSNNDDRVAYDSLFPLRVTAEVREDALFLQAVVENQGQDALSSRLVLAAYDKVGRLLWVRVTELQTASWERVETGFEAELQGKSVNLKLFWLDAETYAPLYAAWEGSFAPED